MAWTRNLPHAASIKHCRWFSGHLLGEPGREKDAAAFRRLGDQLSGLEKKEMSRRKGGSKRRETTFSIDGQKIKDLRISLGLTQAEFVGTTMCVDVLQEAETEGPCYGGDPKASAKWLKLTARRSLSKRAPVKADNSLFLGLVGFLDRRVGHAASSSIRKPRFVTERDIERITGRKRQTLRKTAISVEVFLSIGSAARFFTTSTEFGQSFALGASRTVARGPATANRTQK